MITSITAPLLKTLSKEAGLTTGWVSKMASIRYCDDSPRRRSAAIRAWLVELQKQGLVTTLDDEKPICWKLTAEGKTQLAEWERIQSFERI